MELAGLDLKFDAGFNHNHLHMDIFRYMCV